MMNILSTLFEFNMGANDLHKLISDAEKAEAKNNFSEARAKLNKAKSLCGNSMDDMKKLEAYMYDLEKKEVEYKSTESKNRILRALEQFDINYAKDLYDKAHGNELSDDDDAVVYKEITFVEYYIKAKNAFRDKDLDIAADQANKALSLYNPPKDVAKELFDSICQEKKAIEDENRRNGPQLLVPFGTFNIPKKENEGEDADPISLVSPNLNWGFIGVFDGMGGAGSKKYKHVESGEEHTSAYWGARIVRDCVEVLIKNRRTGENPVDWMDRHIHETIKSKLDEKVKEFPNANGAVLSKMTRKLPTTMAMSGYEIVDNIVAITTYWAGDSRVYLLLKDTIKKSNDCNEYLNNIKEAIIENDQQDDFSISIVGFGCNSFEDYKSVLSSDADNELIKEYYRWREAIEKQRSSFKAKISDIETQLKACRDEEERLHSIEEQKNLEWYAKYKETFSVINREDIKSI